MPLPALDWLHGKLTPGRAASWRLPVLPVGPRAATAPTQGVASALGRGPEVPESPVSQMEAHMRASPDFCWFQFGRSGLQLRWEGGPGVTVPLNRGEGTL